MVSDASGRNMVLCCLKKNSPELCFAGRAGDRDWLPIELKFRLRCEVFPAGLPEVGELTEWVPGGAREPVPQLD